MEAYIIQREGLSLLAKEMLLWSNSELEKESKWGMIGLTSRPVECLWKPEELSQ